MAVNDRPTEQGAVAPPPSNTEYSPSGVFDREGVTLAAQGGTSSSSIAESTLTPSGTGGGTGTEPNDTPITIMAGNGLAGGGNFTTNQAAASTITLDLPPVGMMGTFGTADMPVQSVSVDGFGRVTAVTLSRMLRSLLLSGITSQLQQIILSELHQKLHGWKTSRSL